MYTKITKLLKIYLLLSLFCGIAFLLPKQASAASITPLVSISNSPESTTATSMTATDVSIAGTSLANGIEYLVLYSASIGGSDTSAVPEAEVTFGGTAYAKVAGEGRGLGASIDSGPLSGFFTITGDGSSGLAMNFRCITTSDTCYIDGKSLIAIPLDDLVEGTDYFVSEGTNSDSPSNSNMTNIATSWTNIESATFNLPETGNYLALMSVELGFTSGGATANKAHFRANIDGSPRKVAYQKEWEDNNDWFSMTYAQVLNLSSGNRDFIVQAGSDSNAETDARRGRIFVIKESAFNQMISASDTTGASTAASTCGTAYSDYTALNQTYTPNQQEYVLSIANFTLDSSTTNANGARILNNTDTTAFGDVVGGYQNNNSTDIMPISIFGVEEISTAKDYKVQFCRESSATTVIDEGDFILLGLTVPPPPTKVVFTNASRTLTAGACNGAGSVFTMQLQDAADTPTNPRGSTVIRVTSNSSDYTIYSDDTCSTPVSNGDFTFTTAQNTKDVYIIDNKKSISTRTLTATQQSGPDSITTGNQNYTVNAGTVTRLVVTLPGQTFTDGVGNSGSPTNRTAGSSFNITSISATDSFFNVNTGYSGGKTLAYAGPGNAPNSQAPSYTTSVSFTSGQSTTTLATTLYNAESTTITVTEGGSYGYASSSVTVDAGALNDFVVTVSSPQTAGVCFTGTNTVTARDTWENTRTQDTSVANMTSTGTGVTFYTTGSCGTPTTQYTLSSGTTNIFVSTDKKQSFTVTATKDGSTETGTSSSITVNAGTVTRLVVTLPGQTFTDGVGNSGSPTNRTAGSSFNITSISATDSFFNVNTGYSGGKTLAYAGPGNAPNSQAPSYTTSVSFTNGQSTTTLATILYKAESTTITITDGGQYGHASSTVAVDASDVDNYSVVPASASQTAGVVFNVTISARDAWENLLGSAYSPPAGTYAWATNASNAPDTTAPSLGTLAQGDFTNGVAVKSVTLYKAESGVTFTASEPGPSTVTGTSTTTITVSAGDISADSNDSTITGDATTMEGVPITVTILLRDTWRNPKVGVSNSNITLASSGGGESITQPNSPTDSSGETTGSIEWSTTGLKVVDVTISTVTLVQNDGTTPDVDGKLDNTHSVTVTVYIPQGIRVVGDLNIKGDTRIR